MKIRSCLARITGDVVFTFIWDEPLWRYVPPPWAKKASRIIKKLRGQHAA